MCGSGDCLGSTCIPECLLRVSESKGNVRLLERALLEERADLSLSQVYC